jgi:hypothetical protein
MIDCERAEEIVSQELDGQASPEERDDLTAHLAGCARCRAWRERQLKIHESLESTLSGGRRPSAVPMPVRPSRPRLSRLAAAAALAIAAGCGLAFIAYRAGHRSGLREGADLAARSRPPAREASDRPERRTGGRAGVAEPEALWTSTETRVPVSRGLVWDDEHGLRREFGFDRRRLHRLTMPDSSLELEWGTSDREIRLVGLDE